MCGPGHGAAALCGHQPSLAGGRGCCGDRTLAGLLARAAGQPPGGLSCAALSRPSVAAACSVPASRRPSAPWRTPMAAEERECGGGGATPRSTSAVRGSCARLGAQHEFERRCDARRVLSSTTRSNSAPLRASRCPEALSGPGAVSQGDSLLTRAVDSVCNGLSAVTSAVRTVGAAAHSAIGNMLGLSLASSREGGSPAGARHAASSLPDPAPLDGALRGVASHGPAPHVRACSPGGLRHGATPHGMALRGTALHGVALHGPASRGSALHGAAPGSSSSSSRERASLEVARRVVPASRALAGCAQGEASKSRADFDNSAG